MKTVFRYIYRYEDAVDVVTDGFVKAFRHFDKFRCVEDAHLEKILMGWLKRILINTAIDALRKKSMLPEIGGIPDDVWEIRDRAEADQLVLYKEIIRMVKELPPSYRVAFNMYVVDGYSHVEIAELLGISVGASKSALSRARSILQRKIREMDEINYATHR